VLPAIQIAQFERAFPGWYHDPARWPTRDGYVPWKMFYVLWNASWAMLALERVNLARAASLALGAGDKGARLIARELEEAYPA
jgi:hypothetical protein